MQKNASKAGIIIFFCAFEFRRGCLVPFEDVGSERSGGDGGDGGLLEEEELLLQPPLGTRGRWGGGEGG